MAGGGQFRSGGWLTLLGYELAVKERLRESTPIFLPTPSPCSFLSALPLGGCELLTPFPKPPGSMTTVSTRAMGREFISEREQGRLQTLCGELSPSMLPVLSSKQDRPAFFTPGPFFLSLFPRDRQAAISFLGLGRPREYWFPGGWQAVACPSQLFPRCLLCP